jgi:hypothetical protein
MRAHWRYRRTIAHLHWHVAKRLERQGQTRLARRFFLNSVICLPTKIGSWKGLGGTLFG